MSVYLLDVAELYRRLDAQRVQLGMTWRRVAEVNKISASTLTRLKEGCRPDADALVSLLVWLDLDVEYVTMPEGGQ